MNSGLPDNLPVFSEEEIRDTLLRTRILAWLSNNSSDHNWHLSKYGNGFELSSLRASGWEYTGQFWWNGALWIASPFDGETKSFAEMIEAVSYVESFS